MSSLITSEQATAVCRRYIAAIEKGDLQEIDALFSQSATVRTPVSGHKPAREFYSYVFEVISDRKMIPRDVFLSSSNPNRIALFMTYTRTVRGNAPGTIETVDMFDLTETFDQISAANILYDTSPIRSDFSAPENRIDG